MIKIEQKTLQTTWSASAAERSFCALAVKLNGLYYNLHSTMLLSEPETARFGFLLSTLSAVLLAFKPVTLPVQSRFAVPLITLC